MNMWLWIIGATLAAWMIAAVGLGLIIGRVISRADHERDRAHRARQTPTAPSDTTLQPWPTIGSA